MTSIQSKKLNLGIDDSALFGLSACFGNSVALGIPLVYSILGPINAMPYMILVFFHGFIHFSYTTIIIEGYRNRNFNYILNPNSVLHREGGALLGAEP